MGARAAQPERESPAPLPARTPPRRAHPVRAPAHRSARQSPARAIQMSREVDQKAPKQPMKQSTLLLRVVSHPDAGNCESAPVKEVFEGGTSWEGMVEFFDLVGHPTANRAYAWSYRDGDQTKSITVLQLAPVDSPQSVVKVAIASKARQLNPPPEKTSTNSDGGLSYDCATSVQGRFGAGTRPVLG